MAALFIVELSRHSDMLLSLNICLTMQKGMVNVNVCVIENFQNAIPVKIVRHVALCSKTLYSRCYAPQEDMRFYMQITVTLRDTPKQVGYEKAYHALLYKI